METIFRSIVEGAPDPIFIQTGENFAYLNRAACRLFGVQAPQERTGTPVLEFIHPGYHDTIREKIQGLSRKSKTGYDRLEIKILRTDGSEVWIEATVESIVYEGNNGVLFFLRDISRRKVAEKALRRSEQKYRNVFLKHIAVKLLIDPLNGDIVEANEAASRFYGWSIEEMKKMNISQINTLSFPEIRSEMQRAGTSENTRFSFRHRTAHGDIRDVEVYSNKICSGDREFLHSIIHDVTEKKKAEKQLKLLSRSVEQSPVSTIITNIHGEIEYVNPVFEKITGYSLREVRGQNPRFLKSGHQSEKFYQNLWNTILSGKDWSGEMRNKRKNGELYWIRAIISPILNSRGEVTNFVSIREDITQRKKMVEDLVAAKERAEESDRLKMAFLANMSHEIRTPMNGILGFAEILRQPGLTRGEREKFIDIIENSGQRMLDTVNDLVDISKIETGQVKMYITETNIKEQLGNLFDFFMPQARQKGLQLILKDMVPPSLAFVNTDRNKLDSILTNLIKNAIKFTPLGKIEVGCRQKGIFLEFYVRDTGIGVPHGKQAAVFKRFEQADIEGAASLQGSGLGLAISKAYVEMLGGEITLESQPGHGSLFSFTIPLQATRIHEGAPGETKTFKNNGIPQLRGKKILIAEDDLFSREMIVYQLGKTGAILSTACDGRETVDMFKKDIFDLVLLDIRLPEMDGFEVLGHLRSANPSVPVIAQTAYAMLEDIRKFREAGFTDYLTKPMSLSKLYYLLGKYLPAPAG
jgi:PAS domain S-box-containing protein